MASANVQAAVAVAGSGRWTARQCAPAHQPTRLPALQVVPTRKVRSKKRGGAAAAAAGTGGAAAAAAAAVGEEEEEEEEGGGLNPDDLLPRTDISGSITPALISMISSSNWKERNAGVDQVRCGCLGIGGATGAGHNVHCSRAGVAGA